MDRFEFTISTTNARGVIARTCLLALQQDVDVISLDVIERTGGDQAIAMLVEIGGDRSITRFQRRLARFIEVTGVTANDHVHSADRIEAPRDVVMVGAWPGPRTEGDTHARTTGDRLHDALLEPALEVTR